MNPAHQLREVLSIYPQIRLAVLYGSLARGQQRRDSDVDLGVALDDEDRWLLGEIEVAIGRRLQRDVDLVDLRRAPPLLRFEISRDGVLLLEREPDTWTSFKARAMVDWWDWAPTARFLHRAAAARLRRQLRGQA